MSKRSLLFEILTVIVLINFSALLRAQNQQNNASAGHLFQNPSLPIDVRVNDLVSKLTLEEKISQLQHTSAAIPRLGIPQYNWWNECLHGVARNGIATVFPQAIGMAATFNPALIQQEAEIISTEARAKYYEAVSINSRDIYQGLTFWSPNINIFRDPRWGRGQETYGEDPFLTSEIGKAFVKGLQGDDPKYFKVIATAKHFAVHSGPESQRHKFDAWPSKRDLYETYLPAFEALVTEAKVYSVMTCYNRVFGTPSSANTFLFKDILREKWNFKGYVVSDCWAISDIYSFHNFVPTAEKAAALSLLAGTDLSCGPEYGSLGKALTAGYISEYDLNIAVKRLFEARFRLGLFDPDDLCKYASIKPTDNNTAANRSFALEVARQSIVLLKNSVPVGSKQSILPILQKTKTIAVIGPYANDTSVLLGNYNGIPSNPVTILQGIRNMATVKAKIFYAKGVERPEIEALDSAKRELTTDNLTREALTIAQKCDVVVFVGGISPNLEGEEMDVKVEGFHAGDRTTLDLPKNQLSLLEQLHKTGKPVVLVLTGGSALALNWAQQNLSAIIQTWYPGEEGGNALAEVLFGKTNPAGRLPVTFYKSVNDIPAFEDYSMNGRTYKYFSGEPLYAFGFGLSYTSFNYNSILLNKNVATVMDTIKLTVSVTNNGKFDGDEVVQIYFKQPTELEGQPIKSLVAFKREHFHKGETKTIDFLIPVNRLRHFDSNLDDYSIAKGLFEFYAASSSDNIKLKTELKIR